MDHPALGRGANDAAAFVREERSLLNGALPMAWLLIAANLPGRSLHVGMALWYAGGFSGSAPVRLGNTLCWHFGLDRNAKYRGLRLLEGAGLITVKRKRGRPPMVTIRYCSDTR